MDKSNILLIGGNYFPEPTGIGKYNGEMMKWLAQQGHTCTVITTFPYYPHWKIQHPYVNRSFWFKTETIKIKQGNLVKVIRCPHFVPKNPSGFTRLVSEFSFFLSAYLVIMVLLFRKSFDYVITVAPPFEMGLLGILYKKIKGGKFIYHIQDLQVDAARDLGLVKSQTFLKALFYVERYIINKSDTVSTISRGMIKKVNTKCDKEVVYFPNWVDLDVFYPIREKEELKKNFGFNASDTIFLYSGAIGKKQGLEAILHSAKKLAHLPHIKFAICGSGPYKEALMRQKEKMNLDNVVFLPLQPFRTFNSFLNIADAHLVLQKAEASDLVLPSKLSTILAVGGVAIVTASEGTSLYNIMSSTNMGIVIKPENQRDLDSVIENFVYYESDVMSENARNYAEKHLSADRILSRYFDQIISTDRPYAKNTLRRYLLPQTSRVRFGR